MQSHAVIVASSRADSGEAVIYFVFRATAACSQKTATPAKKLSHRE
jgi:hypothetical protein